MKSEDTSDILFNKLFKFKLKRRYKDNKQKEYTTKRSTQRKITQSLTSTSQSVRHTMMLLSVQ